MASRIVRASACSPSGESVSVGLPKWRIGTTRTWVGACGFRSRNATAASVRATIVAGISPAAILQKMQSAIAVLSRGDEERECRDRRGLEAKGPRAQSDRLEATGEHLVALAIG